MLRVVVLLHQSKSTAEPLQTKTIHLLERPSQSSDLNPAEVLWLKISLQIGHPDIISGLKQLFKEKIEQI